MTITHEELQATFAETWAVIAEGRRRADQLAAEDGSVAARRAVKTVRIRMSLWERSTNQLIEWLGGRGADISGFAAPKAS